MRACLLELARQRVPEDHDRLAAHAEALARGGEGERAACSRRPGRRSPRSMRPRRRVARHGRRRASTLPLGGEAPVVGGEDHVGGGTAASPVRGGGIPCGGRSGSGCLLERAGSPRRCGRPRHAPGFANSWRNPGREAGRRFAPRARGARSRSGGGRGRPAVAASRPPAASASFVFGVLPLGQERGRAAPARCAAQERSPSHAPRPQPGAPRRPPGRAPRSAPAAPRVAGELLGPLGRWPAAPGTEPLADLLLDVARALDLRRDPQSLSSARCRRR